MPFERLERRRLFAAGDLDLGFGSGGHIDIDLTSPLFGVQRVIPVTGGDMLVIGQEIRRFHANGSPDLTFGGGDGVMPLPQAMINANNYLENAALLPDGRVVAVVRNEIGTQTIHQIVLFNADGSPADMTLPVGLGEIDQFVVQPDGKVIVIGAHQAIRFNSDFQPDPTFGLNGVLSTHLSNASIDPASDGTFFAVGTTQTTPPLRAIVKFTAAGNVDNSFGNDGQVIVHSDVPATVPVDDVEVDPTNNTLLTALSGKIGRLALNGEFESSFGSGGFTRPTFGDIAPAIPRLTRLPSGKILIVKGAGVTRLNADGTIDPDYGRVVANFPGQGILSANDAGEVLFTADGVTRTLALHRLTATSVGPGPIRLEPDGTLFCFGSESYDDMRASRQSGDLVIFRRRDDIGRVFDPADVTLLHFEGLGDNDFISLASAGAIRSTVSGGDGNDKILGGDGADSLSGNAGRDTLFGGNGADRLGGNGGRDKLLGEGGADRCYGGTSGDWLLGAGGNDQLFGEGGNDHIQGGSGTDTLDGSAGDDLLISNDSAIDNGGWVDHLWGDRGQDRSVADPNDILSSIEFKLDAMPY
ncbi:MAG: hypothetical protein QOE14_1398 [Humisphaera sp.]|nr:hypothetical protein [Humisphaera sp.]